MFYEKYWDTQKGHLSDFSLKWPVLSKYIPTASGVSILDFGCGKGEILYEITKINPHARCIGLDVSHVAIQDAKKKNPHYSFFQINDGGKFPIPDNSIDFVFSSEVIEHVYDTENAIQEISRILKPGGVLLMTTPFHGFLKNLSIALLNFDEHFNPIGSHVRFFSKKTLSALFLKFGLMPKKYEYYGRCYPFSHSIVILAEKNEKK